MLSSQLEVEKRVIKIPLETIGVPNIEAQNNLQVLSHMDLVISHMSMELL
jgi:hypothetical protein